MLGHLPLSDEGGFPILLKYLDASQNLSVQVHPSQAYADAHADAFLKSEAWYIVDAAPDAEAAAIWYLRALRTGDRYLLQSLDTISDKVEQAVAKILAAAGFLNAAEGEGPTDVQILSAAVEAYAQSYVQ